MSFLDIKDPKKRDSIVADYLATVKRLQHRDINERAQDLVRQDDLNQMFEPVVKSTGKSTDAITKELVPIREEMKTLNKRLVDTTEKMKDAITMKQQQSTDDHTPNVLEQYLLKYGGSRVLDKYFAIQRVGDNKYEMGTKAAAIDENSDIIVDGVKYDGTTGLWALIMMNDPPESSYTSNDLRMYKDFVYRTNVMSHPHNVVLGRSRYNKTKKWTHVFPLFKTVSSDDDGASNHNDNHDDDDDDDDAAFHDSFQHASWANKNDGIESHQDGDGIQFLPGDIKGLETKLNYLLAEYRAGNRSSLTRNQIVSILDELSRRKRISRKEYRDINAFLQ